MKPLALLVPFALFISACASTSTAPVPTLTPTETALPTATLPPAQPTVTSTPLPTETATPIPSPTPTDTPPSLTANLGANCRQGPGLTYPVLNNLAQGQSAEILGQDEDSTWWYIAHPDGQTECWLYGEIVSLSGDPYYLPVVDVPPPPTGGPVGAGIVNYFFILGTGGPLGCGDSIFYNNTGQVRTGDLERDIATALQKQLSNRAEYVGDLYNPLHKSNLKVNGVDFDPASGHVAISLNGSMSSTYDCEAKRMGEQVLYTLSQFPEVKSRVIWLNSGLFEDFTYCPDC